MDFYQLLSVYGDQIKLERTIDSDSFINWTESNFEYLPYNPRKVGNRFGLSITSLTGDMSGIPDLDSIGEYNNENRTSYSELDFKEFTPVYTLCHELQQLIEPWKHHIGRSHVLRLDAGGFFPPHRDSRSLKINTFRLIVPLKRVTPPSVNFIIDDKLLHWDTGHLYFVNTAKMHYLFNASFSPSYWIVFNVECNQYTIDQIFNNLTHR